MSINTKPSDEFLTLMRKAGDPDYGTASAAQREIAKAIETPLRRAILAGNILDNIFERRVFEPGQSVEFPLDFVNPGEEIDHVAYTNPGHGRIPERANQGDYVMVPTYSVANAEDVLLRYIREARWDVVGRLAQVMESGFVKKMNDDGWHTLLAAGVDRGILVYDADAAASQFTKRLLSLLKVIMERNAGGNSGSTNRGRCTDVWLSPEGLEDIRNWGVDQLDEVSRREVYVAADGSPNLSRVFGVNLHSISELGESQEYQNYYTSQLAGTLGPASDVELLVALDLVNRDSFMMPIKQEVTISEDPYMHRQQRFGVYGWAELGFAVLDTRRILVGSF